MVFINFIHNFTFIIFLYLAIYVLRKKFKTHKSMRKLSRFSYNGKSVYLIDYSGLENEHGKEFIEQIDAYNTEINKLYGKHLFLVDVRDSYMNSNIVGALKSAALNAKPKTKKMSVIGVNKVKRIN